MMKDQRDLSTTRYRLRFALLALIVAAGACASRRGGGPQPPVIYFTNESLDQATVYVVAPGRDFRRIGTVLAGQTDTLTVPLEMASTGAVNIVARLLARPDLAQTGPVSLSHGERYQVQLLPNSRLMSLLPAGS